MVFCYTSVSQPGLPVTLGFRGHPPRVPRPSSMASHSSKNMNFCMFLNFWGDFNWNDGNNGPLCLVKSIKLCLLRVKCNFKIQGVPPTRFDGFWGSAKNFSGPKGSIKRNRLRNTVIPIPKYFRI